MQPDWASFATAIEEFREEAGETVQFTCPVESTYPPGTVLDPNTGKPYDPTIEADNEGAVLLVECTALVVRGSANASRAKDDVTSEALGLVQVGEAVFIVAFAEYRDLELERATEVRGIGGTPSGSFLITETTFDKTGGNGESDRALIRGELTVA